MESKFDEILQRELTPEELYQLKKIDLVEIIAILQARMGFMLTIISDAVDLAQKIAAITVSVSKRLSKTLDLLFGGSLKSKAKLQKARAKNKKPKAVARKVPLSVRYRHLEVEDIEVKDKHPPQCKCGHEMTDSGMRGSSERLNVTPKIYRIFRYNRVIYTCKKCNQGIAAALPVPQIIPGSCYGDSLVLDVVLSKLCDLIPVSRYVAIAERSGVKGLPANSFYDFFRHVAIYLGPSYKLLEQEVKSARILSADETRHRMLERSERKNWYLWSFNCSTGVIYRIEDTRAAEVATNFLMECDCEVLVSDAYKGYYKAILDVHAIRSKESDDATFIIPGFCNSHARNKFCASAIKNVREARYMIWIYKIVFVNYRSYVKAQGEEFKKLKNKLERAFRLMERIAEREMAKLSTNSILYDAFNYFYTYYSGLTLFLRDREVPMHNMRSEQSLRNPVIGRKIWFGTHSPEAARNIAKTMSLVETCKMINVSPRAYVDDAIMRIHKGLPAITPYQYKLLIDSS